MSTKKKRDIWKQMNTAMDRALAKRGVPVRSFGNGIRHGLAAGAARKVRRRKES
jgi:hypothetical protein